MKERIKLFYPIFIVLLLVGCTEKTDDHQPGAIETEKGAEQTDMDEKNRAEDEDSKDGEIETIKPNENLGAMDIELAGIASIDGSTVKVEGQTNLLEGSKLFIDMEWVEGTLIGGNWSAFVESDGSFTYETELPEKVTGLLTVEVKFVPADQNEEIREHYGESGEQLEGAFIRQYDYQMKEIVYNQASATVELLPEEGPVQVEITPPTWEIPNDYGSTTVRIEPMKVVKDERYIYIDGKSNLLEGTSLRGRALLPAYVTSGFIGYTTVNPDGSFRIIFENPETDSRINNLDDYEITLETDLSNTLFVTAVEAYGEQGEKMTGDLVEPEGDGKKAIVRIQEKKE